MASVHFIAYQLKTSQIDLHQSEYVGLPDPQQDLEARCMILLDAIEAAERHGRFEPGSLKIFAAPEFFFRGGTSGAYSIEQVANINRILDPFLSQLRYREWIFFMGSAIAHIPSEVSDRIELLNITLIRRGGVVIDRTLGPGDSLSKEKENALLIYKETISPMDHLGLRGEDGDLFSSEKPAVATLFGRRSRLHIPMAVAPSTAPRAENSGTGLGGGTLFTMCGYRFVCEICRDHGVERAEKSAPKNIDFHVVISCGTDPNYNLAAPGGFLFLIDGMEGNPDERVHLYRNEQGESKMQGGFHHVPMDAPKEWTRWGKDGRRLFHQGRGAVCISRAYRFSSARSL